MKEQLEALGRLRGELDNPGQTYEELDDLDADYHTVRRALEQRDRLAEALEESTKQLRDGVVRADSPKSRQIHRNEELLREIREGK